MDRLLKFYNNNILTIRNFVNLNFIYFSNVIIQIILIPLLITAYGLDGYGGYIFLFSIVNYSDIFVRFGFEYYLLWFAVEIKENNETYVLNPNTNDVYYYDSYKNALELGTELLLYGKLVKVKGKAHIEKVKN